MSDKKAMWQTVVVKWNFVDRLCGSMPMSKDLVPIWLKSRMPNQKPDNARPMEEIEHEVLASIEETEERTMLGFQSDDTGYWVRGGNVKAHLKDCANQIKDVVGIKAFRSKIASKIYLDEYKIYLNRNGGVIQESDGSFEQPVHVMTMQGPRSALKVINYVRQPQIAFTLKFLKDKEVGLEQIKQLMEYGCVHGFGGERGMGEGRYEFEIVGE